MNHRYFLDIANSVAKKSKDPNTKVGALIVTDNRIVATGYNGYVAGAQDNNLPKLAPEKYEYFIHAEINALLSTVNHGVPINDGTIVYITHSPCPNCVRLMWQAGIKKFIVKTLHNSWLLYENMLDLKMTTQTLDCGSTLITAEIK